MLTRHLKHPSWKWRKELPRGLDASYTSSIEHRKPQKFDTRNCRMETCFNHTKCKGTNREFNVYVYPDDVFGPSDNYAKVNNTLFL